MKERLLFTIAVLATTNSGALAQGTVVFANSASTPITFGTTTTNPDVPGSFLPSGTRFLVELYYAPDGSDPGNAGMQRGMMGPAVGIADIPADAGRYAGGIRTTPMSTAPGAQAWFQVRTWESAFGSTFEEAVAAGPRDINGVFRTTYCGASGRFNIVTGTAVSPAPLTSAGLVLGFSLNDLACIPEPSPLSLCILAGVGGLLCACFRRAISR